MNWKKIILSILINYIDNFKVKKKALSFGITGQDGSYLAEFLVKKGYFVHGVKRRSSSLNTTRVDHIYQDPHEKRKKFFLHYGDVTDAISVSSLIKKIKPNEIYNLAAQSHVSVSFATTKKIELPIHIP